MKHSVRSRYCCHFCFCCGSSWLTMLFLASSVVHVSPEIPSIITNTTPITPQHHATTAASTSESASASTNLVRTRTTMTFGMSDRTTASTEVWQPYQYTANSAAATSGDLRAPLIDISELSESAASTQLPADADAYSAFHSSRRSSRQADSDAIDKCRLFVEGEPNKNELYSPDYPSNYPKNINCTRIIIAPKGQIIRLDFRNSFHIEAKEECKFDFLEIRDGQYGFSNLIGKYCGTDFPPEITSKERYLWLHFHSDESIEYSGFTAVYEFIDRSREAPSTDLNCTIEKDGFEGFINSSDVPAEIKDNVIRNKIALDCMWRIQVLDKWKIQVKFMDFKLSKPNDCESNFLDIFPEQTIMPLRVKNFCGSAGEGITSDTNILHMRFYAEQTAINSTFSILYTAFRDRGSAACADDEYDCEDATCISKELYCNGRDNCKFRWDEEGCLPESDGQSEHVIIIIIVFGLILGGMVITFLVNCVHKIIRDQKIIREHIRQSKESKLDELSRHSKARSREPASSIAITPREKHSQTSLQILDDVSNHYYRDVVPISVQTSKADLHEKEHSILRHHHDMIVQTSLCSDAGDDSSHSQAATHDMYTTGACDMGCQTRESLFATSLLRQKSISSSIGGGGGGGMGIGMEHGLPAAPPPPAPRFSTFGYEQPAIQSRHGSSSTGARMVPGTIEILDESHHPRYPHTSVASVKPPQEICHHHHHHQHQHQHQHQQHQPPPPQQAAQSLGQTRHQQSTVAQPASSAPHMAKSIVMLPVTGAKQITSPPTATTTPTNASSGSGNGKNNNTKQQQSKVDQSKVFIDLSRNSAPDVIIMTSH